MFNFDTSIHMVGFVLWLGRDRDEDARFHMINPSCVDLLSIHDGKLDHFCMDDCFHVVNPCIVRCLILSILTLEMSDILYYV